MLEKFLLTLDIMWKGMFGIFAVIILITFIVMFIQWLEKTLINKSNKTE